MRPREPLDDGGEGAGIVKLAGEDALLDWPNALGPGAPGALIEHVAVIQDRACNVCSYGLVWRASNILCPEPRSPRHAPTCAKRGPS